MVFILLAWFTDLLHSNDCRMRIRFMYRMRSMDNKAMQALRALMGGKSRSEGGTLLMLLRGLRLGRSEGQILAGMQG